jgi:Asp-tRNA(Asn)/Glu-tRNA(Gln) amidotransferase A subunit family amidase
VQLGDSDGFLDLTIGRVKTHKPNELTAWQASRLLSRRELRAQDLMRACLDRIAERDAAVQAFVTIDAEAALAQARALDAGAIRGPLHGLPLAVKDLFDTAALTTSYGSAIYAGHRPLADAAAVALCREAGAVVIGKTVTTELAYFHPGPTRNPRALGHTPGGSSSGSAAAVADLMAPLALGTQTAGSIVRPAAFCGVVGYKPSWGRVPRAGVKSLSNALDTVGCFGRSVRDVALLGALLTADMRLLVCDTSIPAPRIALCRTPQWPLADADTQRAWSLAASLLAPQAASLTEIELPADLPDLVALQKTVMSFEMARSFSHERVQHRDRLSEPLRVLMDQGMAVSGADHMLALLSAAAARQRVRTLFDRFDAVLAPSAVGEAPVGTDATGDPVFCRGWTLLGLPCIHLPFTQGSQGLPIGLQVVGRHGDDHRLLATALWLHERLTG